MLLYFEKYYQNKNVISTYLLQLNLYTNNSFEEQKKKEGFLKLKIFIPNF